VKGNPTIIKILIGGFSMIQIDKTATDLPVHLYLDKFTEQEEE